jgi:hypothetical protein
MVNNMTLPRARQQELIIEELFDEVLVYDLTRNKAHCLNQTAASIWRSCDGHTSVRRIAQQLGKELGTRIDEEFVWIALKQLANSKLLEEPVEIPVHIRGLSRRQMMKLSLSAAVAFPLVISILAPNAQAQVSECGRSGVPCLRNEQCCSFVCNLGRCL